MDSRSFLIQKEIGDNGEQFFLQRHNEILQHNVITLLDMSDWFVEGSDVCAERLLLVPSQHRDCLVPLFQLGGVEVKTSSYDTVLPRTGVEGQLTWGVPIWAGDDRHPRQKHGNVKRWLYPSVETRSARPMIIVQLFANPNGSQNGKYFASVAFEDVEKLLNRLIKYALLYGLDLTNWESIPVGKQAKEFSIPGLIFQGNMWHVPMEWISDLATVTLIGDGPDFCGPINSIQMQHKKYEYLQTLAAGRWIPQLKPDNIQSDAELFNSWHNKFMPGIPKYSGILDKSGNPM